MFPRIMNRKIAWTLAVACWLLLVTADQASAITVYINDFEGAVGTEWNTSMTDVTPKGERRFLGQFLNDTITLSLSNLPSHSFVSVSFDLFIIRSWDGNFYLYGPDIWMFGTSQGELLKTTFSNEGPAQAYPGTYPTDSYSCWTGASEVRTLGYDVVDSVYHITVPFSHEGSSLSLYFAAQGLYSLPDESWGIDNVRVDVSSVPTPSALVLLGSGLVGLMGLRHLRSILRQ